MNTIKQAFATGFIEAIADNAPEKLYTLCNNYHDMQKMETEIDFTEEKLKEIVLMNCTNFLKTVNFDISDYALESTTVKGNEDAIANLEAKTVLFLDEIRLHFAKADSPERLTINVPFPIIVEERLKINNPLMIEFREYKKVKQVPPPDSITVLDSNNKSLELIICERDFVRSHLKKYKVEDESYISDQPWYLYEGNMELDEYTFSQNIIITGDLLIHEPLVSLDSNLVVVGKTVVNALVLSESSETFLLGGIVFNVALFSLYSGPSRTLQNLNGPFAYCNSEATTIEGTTDVLCYIDNVYSDSHGDVDSVFKKKYILKEDGYIDVDTDLLLEDIKHSKEVFKDSAINPNVIQVKKPDLEDRSSLISLLKKDGFYLKELNEKHRADKELIDIALNYHTECFNFIADHLKTDEAYIYELVKNNGRILEYVDDRFKKDRKLVLLAIESSPYALDDAHESLKADKELVLFAINKNAKVLQYADEALKGDEDVLLAAIENNVEAFKYAAPTQEVIDNEKVMLALLKKDPKYMEIDVLSKYRNDKQFILKVLEVNHNAFVYLEEKLQKDPDIRAMAGRV